MQQSGTAVVVHGRGKKKTPLGANLFRGPPRAPIPQFALCTVGQAPFDLDRQHAPTAQQRALARPHVIQGSAGCLPFHPKLDQTRADNDHSAKGYKPRYRTAIPLSR